MSTRTVSVILHGHEWPDPSWTQALRSVLAVPPGAGPASLIEVLEAREDPGDAKGAAAAINRAAERARGDLLLVIEAGCAWEKRLLADLGSSVWQADVLAVAAPGYKTSGVPPAGPDTASQRPWNDAWVPSALPLRADLPALLSQACTISLEEWTAQLHAARPRLWALRRATLRALGALDPAFWSVGLVEDLADRAAARGIAVRLCSGPAAADSLHDAWPLRPHIQQLLAIRSALTSASRTQPPRLAGRAMGVIASLAMADAWRQAEIATDRLTFGGAWGRGRSLTPRRASRSGSGDALWPARPGGALLPILALDSFLDALVDRLKDPSHISARASAPDHAGTPVESTECERPHEHSAPASAVAGGAATANTGASTGGEAVADVMPFASVVVVNWNGREHLSTCFSSLLASVYPADRIEFICVDNGSSDGSRELLAEKFPSVRVVALPENRGFTGGNNAGVAAARGDVLVFFNNDMRVEPDTVRALVSALDADYPCAAAEVRSWNGRRIDFVRGSLNFEAHGFQDHYGEIWRPDRGAANETFFPNGGAFAITREAYLDAGGFDDLYFAYYDDVDLGYGVRLNGGNIRVVHEARVYHRHGATSRRYPFGQKRFLMERNAIWTVMKRYSEPALDRTFGAVLLLAARRIAQESVLRRGHPWVQALAPFSARCRRRAGSTPPIAASAVYEFKPAPGRTPAMLKEDLEANVAARLPVEAMAAVGEALRGMPQIFEKRRESEARRTAPDHVVFTGMGRPLAYGSPLASYQAAHDAIVESLRLADVFRTRPRLLIITHEPLRQRMSGPGVRVLEMGRALSRHVHVTIATPGNPDIIDDASTLVGYDPDRPASVRRLAENTDAVLIQGFTLAQFPFLTALHLPIIVDLYCPFTVEFLELKTAEAHAHGASAPSIDVQLEAIGVLEVQNAQLRHGDFFLCASERQRDFWLGALHSATRVNSQTYAADATLRNLIDVVPFGVPEEDFRHAVTTARAATGPRVLKGVRPGIGAADHLLFWGGSLLDWQDPLTLIQAVARLARSRSDVKLFFAGTRHPNPQVAPMQIVEASMTLARDLGVLDKAVFFNEWVPYQERAAYLAEADLGLSTHRIHLETHLSFRTRMLDYIWAELPIVCSDGDYFADLVRSRGLGLVVPPGDEEALTAALVRLLDDGALRETCRRALREVREELRWGRVVEPLRTFVTAPRYAADHEPAMRAVRDRLRESYRASKWVKRTALRFGMSEAGFERVKALPPVRVAMMLRNRLALSRAGRIRE